MGDTAAGPLDGIKVVDMSTMISGPLAAMMLADQGADVVKVESPGIGDVMRMLGSQKGGMTGIFANNNRGKRSIVVDLKHRAGVDIVRRLAADADVLIQNFRPGAPCCATRPPPTRRCRRSRRHCSHGRPARPTVSTSSWRCSTPPSPSSGPTGPWTQASWTTTRFAHRRSHRTMR